VVAANERGRVPGTAAAAGPGPAGGSAGSTVEVAPDRVVFTQV
jgi:hypothetical protein